MTIYGVTLLVGYHTQWRFEIYRKYPQPPTQWDLAWFKLDQVTMVNSVQIQKPLLLQSLYLLLVKDRTQLTH